MSPLLLAALPALVDFLPVPPFASFRWTLNVSSLHSKRLESRLVAETGREQREHRQGLLRVRVQQGDFL